MLEIKSGCEEMIFRFFAVLFSVYYDRIISVGRGKKGTFMIRTVEELKDINTDSLDRLPQLLNCDVKDILFIDIETTGLSPRDSDVYMIGAAFCDGVNWQVKQLFAENASQEEALLSAFSDFSRNYKILIHYNGDRFDIPFLQSKYESHKLSDPFARMTSIDLYKKIKPYKRQLGLPDCRQKTVELFLGIDRQDKYDGGKLISVYKDYVNNGDPDLLELLLLHNFEDVKGMIDLLPMLRYDIFFNLFKNMPKVSVRTDEDFTEADFVTDEEALKAEKPSLSLPVRAVKVQANQYKDMDGVEKKEVYMKLVLPIYLPASITGNEDGCYFRAKGNEAVVRVPLIEEELKYFYSNYKDYYYLPEEDVAIHKSLAEFVDKGFKEKAKPQNCYTRKEGQYLVEWDLVFAPFFKRDYDDIKLFFDLNERMKKSRFGMSLYAAHVISHILDI